jgi:hypothetical protein
VYDNNLYMVFQFDGEDAPCSFGYVITQRALNIFVLSNHETGTILVEEEITFPEYLMAGSTRTALIHYRPGGEKFACYVPVFPTEEEMNKYTAAFIND